VRWQGRADSGAPVGSGVYLLRLMVDGRQAGSGKLIVLE
jgi:hypothetical protein